MGERADPLKKMVVQVQTRDELLDWYKDCREDIERCPKVQRSTLRKILNTRFREVVLRLRLAGVL